MRFITGFQPSGQLHLGNYLGAIRPAIELQDQGQGLYFIADYHALTTVTDPSLLRRSSMEMAAALLACGLNPEKSILFRQSDVPEVHELSWLLSTITPVGLLTRSHGYKDKVDKGLPASHGLLAYPVLMSADILLYQADVVPVGPDQKQHLEITRDLAGKFNHQHPCNPPVFTMPTPLIRQETTIPGLDGQKMSKSYGNTIPLFLPKEKLLKLIRTIPTDSLRPEDPKSPETSILAQLMQTLAPEHYPEYAAKFTNGGTGYGQLKDELFEQLDAVLAHFREPYHAFLSNPAELEAILKVGATRARALALPTLYAARQAMGLPTPDITLEPDDQGLTLS